MNVTLDDASTIELGREAKYLSAKLTPYFDIIENQIITQLKRDWQSGQATKDVDMKTCVGMLVAIEQLRNMFHATSKQGERVLERSQNKKPEEELDEHGLEIRPYD